MAPMTAPGGLWPTVVPKSQIRGVEVFLTTDGWGHPAGPRGLWPILAPKHSAAYRFFSQN